MIKDFLEKNTHLKIAIQHLGIHGGGFMVEVYNTTYDPFEPIHKHFVTDFEIERSRADFETMIMVPIENWWEDLNKRRKEQI